MIHIFRLDILKFSIFLVYELNQNIKIKCKYTEWIFYRLNETLYSLNVRICVIHICFQWCTYMIGPMKYLFVCLQMFDSVTILFSDVVTFTEICSRITPMEVVSMLNAMYSIFDTLTERNKVYKVKTLNHNLLISLRTI